MALVEASETVTRLAIERQRDEQKIIAEASLSGERLITWLRLILFMLYGISFAAPALLGYRARHFDLLRTGFIVVYVAYSLIAIVGMRRAQPSPDRAFRGGFAFSAMDFFMVAFMAWRRYVVDGDFQVESMAVSGSVFLAFSIVRFSKWHIFFSTALAIAAYLIVGALTGMLGTSTGFVLASFMCIGVLIFFANRRIGQMFVEVRQRDNLKRFLPSQVAERVLKNAESLQPTQREVTILFTDIRDFTTLSEKLPPKEVLAFLDRYFGHMGQIVKGHEGVVNKFLGDGMLAVWGVPDRDEAHAEKALKAALDMRKKLVEFNQERANEGLPPIRMGIGVHTGIVAAGMLGGADQHEYTVIGDAVNLASRIEGLTKSLGTDLLVSESTWRQLRDRYQGDRAGDEKVKGRAETVVVYRVEGLRRDATPALATA